MKKLKWNLKVFAGVFAGLLIVGLLLSDREPTEETMVERAVERQGTPKIASPTRIEREVAYDDLMLAYILHVMRDALYVSCREAEVEERFFIQCGLSYGGAGLVKIGVWEIARDHDGKVVLYTCNDAAGRALDRIGEGTKFQSGAGRRPGINIDKVRDAIEGASHGPKTRW